MSLYTEIQSDVFSWTNRRTMVTETDMAIRQAIRKAHRAGSFYRDMTTVSVTGLSTATSPQAIDLSASCPLYRQLYTVKPTGIDSRYDIADVRDLLDLDGFPKYNVYWVVGTTLYIRASSPTESVDVTYYRRVNVDNLATLDDWIASEHKDLIVLWAAATVLTIVGEQEVKTRVEELAKLAYADLIADSIEAIGR
jgi:hypothetical protein